MNRRGFLGGLVGVVAAPAIVRAESLMKIWVPPQGIVLPSGIVTTVSTMINGFAGDFVMIDRALCQSRRRNQDEIQFA